MTQLYSYPISAAIARRLAEVADCYRHFSEVYLISLYEFPNQRPDFPEPDVYGYSNLSEAEKEFETKGLDKTKWGIFGPFKVVNEVDIKWDKKKEKIQRATFTVQYKNENDEIDEEIIEIDKETDAVFLNLASFDMFAMPYYAKLYGPDYAKKLRDFILDQYQKIGLIGTVTLALAHRLTRTVPTPPPPI